MKRRTRRLGRILFNTLTAISLLLAIATAGLWVYSGFYVQGITKHDEMPGAPPELMMRRRDFVLESGCLIYLEFGERMGGPPFERWTYSQYPLRRVAGIRRWTPSAIVPAARDPKKQNPGYTVPLVLPLLLSLAMPSVSAWRYVRQRDRRKTGHCPACGYDTRANPAKCSECGHEMPATTEVESA